MATMKAPLIPRMSGLLALRSENDFFEYENRLALLLDRVDDKLLTSYYEHHDESSIGDEEPDDIYMVLERNRLQVINNVAIIKVKGMMSADYSIMEGWLDEGTSYETLIWSVDYIKANHPEVDTVVGLFDTPGGEARGVNGAIEALKSLTESLGKGSYAYAYGELASAGYALATGFNVILADAWADIGSIGVVQPVMSRFNALKKSGIDVYVSRSGPEKMRPSGLEPITDSDKKIIDEEVQDKAELFFSLVTDFRPATAKFQKQWKTGRMFSAQKAVGVGLLDGIQSQNVLLQRLMSS